MQRTEQWKEQRMGLFTSSEIHKLMGVRGLGDTGMTYIYDKVTEVLTGEYPEEISTKSMEWGISLEPYAVDYFNKNFEHSEPTDFILHKTNPQTGSSPDRLIPGKQIGIEIKCPFKSVNHIKYLQCKTAEDIKKLQKNYYWQIMHGLWVTGYKQWWFCSYDPRFPEDLMFHRLEIYPNESDIKLMESRINEAIALKNSILNRIKK